MKLFGKMAMAAAGICAAALTAAAQAPRPLCATYTYQQALQDQDTARVSVFERVYREAVQWGTQAGSQRSSAAVITIPVVVHVVYNTPDQNISDAQIQSQLDVLNEDYRRRNADAANTPPAWRSVAADCEIEFRLATADPAGNPTNGIVRVQTSESQFINDDKVKYRALGGSDIWNRNKYLNIWVCNLGNNFLGYAQFPGGQPGSDGVVIGYRFFGRSGTATPPYHKGRSCTHEIGHWLGLQHIWGDDNGLCSGDDFVSDTPNQAIETYHCPTGSRVSCSNGPNGDMYQNFLDYTDDACMNLFTQGQKALMQGVLHTSRATLLTAYSDRAEAEALAADLRLFPNPTPGNFTVSLTETAAAPLRSLRIIDPTGREVADLGAATYADGQYRFNLSHLPAGLYVAHISRGESTVFRKIALVK